MRWDSTKNAIRHITVFILFCAGFYHLWISLPFRYIDFSEAVHSHALNLSLLKLHYMTQFVLGLGMILLSFNLRRRMRVAWVLVMIFLSGSIAYEWLRPHAVFSVGMAAEILLWVAFAVQHRAFKRRSVKSGVRRALRYFVFSFMLLLLNTAVGMRMLNIRFFPSKAAGTYLREMIDLYFFQDVAQTAFTHRVGIAYLDASMTLFWILLFLGAISLMRPIFFEPMRGKQLKEMFRPLVKANGSNSSSYLALENDKQYFSAEGLVAYTVAGNVMVICGDIICEPEKATAFIESIKRFAEENAYQIVFISANDDFLPQYKAAGFGAIKSGEEACFTLSEYNLKNGEIAKVRAAINHATKAGITVREVFPLQPEDENYVRQMKRISDSWLKGKDAPELVFMLGKNNFDLPMDRRYFCAVNAEGTVLGYCMFNPYRNGKGYIAEITRRAPDAPQGVLEKIIFESFMTFKDEGSEEGSMGVSPLYNVGSDVTHGLTEKTLAYIYDHMTRFYDFKSLHHDKKKYAPTFWKNSYYVYYPRPFTPVFGYAIIRAHLPDKPSKLLFRIGFERVKALLSREKDDH